jgi:hypothetical protein
MVTSSNIAQAQLDRLVLLTVKEVSEGRSPPDVLVRPGQKKRPRPPCANRGERHLEGVPDTLVQDILARAAPLELC